MGVFDKLFGALRVKKFGGYHEQITQIPPIMTTDQYVKAYGEIGWLYACCTKRAEGVASANMHLYRLDSQSDRVELFDHPLVRLLIKPNPHMTGYKLDMLTQLYLDLAGESFWVVERDRRGQPMEIWAVNPAYMWVYPDRENFIKGWAYRCGGDNIPIDPADVIHFYYPDPSNPYRGIGPAQAAGVDLQSSKYAKEWNRRFFFNSARPDAVIEFDRTLDEDEYKTIVDHWRKSHGGTNNAHKIGMLEIGKYKQISTTPKDMDFASLQTGTRDSILSIFGVPKSILGITEDVNRAASETAEYTFAKRTVLPLLRMRQDDLNAQLIPLFPDGDRLEIEYDDPTPEDRAAKLAEWTAGCNRWLSVNEIREEQGREPVEGGDEIRPATRFPAFNFDEDEDETGGEDGSKFLPTIRTATAIPAMIPKSKALVLRKQAVRIWVKGLDREAHWKAFVEKADKRERELAKVWRSIWRRQEDEIAGSLKCFRRQVKDSDPLAVKMRALFDQKAGRDEVESLLSVLDDVGKDSPIFKSLRPQIAKLMADSAEEFFDETGMGIEFDLRNPKVSRYIDQFCAAQIKSINTTTRDDLRAAIRDAEAEGLSLPDIKERISGYFEDASEGRLNTIVRTEVIGASNAGTLAGYEQSGVVESKEWLAAIDERTRESHAHADGQRVPLNDDFVLDDGTEGACPGNMGSPEHDCNCRCTVLPVV